MSAILNNGKKNINLPCTGWLWGDSFFFPLFILFFEHFIYLFFLSWER
jgi:hypothetical protein